MDKPIVINCTIAPGGEEAAAKGIASALAKYERNAPRHNAIATKYGHYAIGILRELQRRKLIPEYLADETRDLLEDVDEAIAGWL